MIVTVTVNPCVDRTVYIDELHVGEIIRATHADTIAGGKGNNVARVVKALGEDVRPVILVGGETGQLIERLLREGDGLEPVACRIGEPSREVVTVLEESTGVQTAYVEPGPHVSLDEANAFVQVATRSFDGADLVVLSGSVPCPALAGIYARLVPLAQERGARVILDTRDEALRLGLEAQPDTLNCNRAEAEQLLGCTIAGIEAAARAVRELCSRGPHLVTLTVGAEGFVAGSAAGTWHVEPPEVEVVNPVGAGDALVGGLAVGLARELPPAELLRFAQAVSAASVGHWHAGTIDRNHIPALLPRVRLRRM